MGKKVGVIGLGIMGGAIAANLVARGWQVFGTDPDAARQAQALANGVQLAVNASDVARAASLILTSLPSASAALCVAEEIAASKVQSRIVAEISTLALEDKLAFAAVLAKGGHIGLDCPISGTGAQALTRDLVVYASGPAQAIDEMAPVFINFARQSINLGAFGNGSRMKYVANLLVAIHNVATAEAMLLGVKAGLDPQQIVEVIGAGVGTSRVFELRAPLMVSGVYEPATMRVNTWQKDMAIIGDFAGEVGCNLPLFAACGPVYAQALALGLGESDTASVYAVLAAQAKPG